MTVKDDWAFGNFYGHADANAVATQVNTNTTALDGKQPLIAAVKIAAPPTGNGTTDTAALQAAHDALPATGGDILLQGGTYALTAAGPTFTKPQGRLVGVGGWGDADSFFATVLQSNATNATALTITNGGWSIEHLAIVNAGGVNPVSGYGIKMTDASNARLNHVWVNNFYDDVRFEGATASAQQWRIVDCLISAPVRYGLFTANPSSPDTGDSMIRGTTFDPRYSSRTAAVAAAIRWESGGGFRLSDSKINGAPTSAGAQFTVGVDFALANAAVTSDLFVVDNSIENCSDTCVKFSRQGTGSVSLCHVQDNEFQGTMSNKIIDVQAGFSDVRVEGNTTRSDSAVRGVSVGNGAGPVHIGHNTWHTTTNPVYIESTAAVGTVVERQTRVGDGVLVNDQTFGLNSPVIDYSYQRPIDWTVTSTPTALWTFGVTNFTGGIIDVAVTGLHSGVGGFVASQKVAWLVDGSGVVTLTTLESVVHGSTSVGLTYTTTANTIVAKLATSAGTDIQGGKAQLNVLGHLTTLKVGA